jgi:EAL domain-containing protein (putative c-di-GMP-specific phosphodiesterase class I)
MLVVEQVDGILAQLQLIHHLAVQVVVEQVETNQALMVFLVQLTQAAVVAVAATKMDQLFMVKVAMVDRV